MLNLYDQERSPGATSNHRDETTETVAMRDVHVLTPTSEDNSRTMRTTTLPPPPAFRGYFSPPRSTTTMSEGASSGENFTTISREFNALVIAGSSMENNETTARDVTQREDERQHDLMRIHEERDHEEETNPLAIVPDQYPSPSLNPGSENGSGQDQAGQGQGRIGMSVQTVKREEVEAKITAWQTAKLAKINNRFKREDAIINGWVNEQVNKANSWMKKIERKLEERKAKAMEKTQNNVAKAQRKAEERRATAEAKRGTEVAKVVEVANLMRAVGRPPSKRSLFSFS